MLAFHNTYWSGNCDGLARLLATNFTSHRVHAGVSDPPVNSSATIAACRADAMSNMFMVFMPEYPAAVAANPDGGGVVELLGQVLAAVVDPVTNNHCGVKGEWRCVATTNHNGTTTTESQNSVLTLCHCLCTMQSQWPTEVTTFGIQPRAASCWMTTKACGAAIWLVSWQPSAITMAASTVSAGTREHVPRE